MKPKLIIVFCLFSLLIQGQDLHVYYNLYKDSLWYERNGKSLSNPEVRKGNNVVLHIIEYNSCLYKADIETSFYSVLPPGYQTETNSFIGMLPNIINSLVPGGSALMPMLNTPILGTILNSFTSRDSLNASRGEVEELEAYKSKLMAIEAKKEEINNLVHELNKRNRAENLLRGDLVFINQLLVNPNLPPSKIKSIVNQYFNEAFLLEHDQIFHMSDMYSLKDKMDGIPALKTDLAQKSQNLSNELTEFKRLHKRVKNSDHNMESLYPLLKEYEAQEPAIESLVNKLSHSIAFDSSRSTFDYLPAIQKFYLKYEELLSNSFAIIKKVEAKSKYILFELDIYQRDSFGNASNAKDALPLNKSLKVKVDTYGDIGLVASVGVNGAGFTKQLESYYIKNNVLEAEKVDQFVPYVSSLFNLTYQMTPKFSPAISVGLGIPIGESKVLGQISYLVGPSIFLGKGKDFAITGGVLFSKVNRLGKNLSIGDTIDVGLGEIPMTSKFESGFFIGISYNISGTL